LEPAAILEAGQTGLRDEKQRLDLMRDLSALYADAGRTRYLKEDYSAAIELLDKSIAVMPTSKGYFFRANTYYRFAQKERQPENRALAIADYRQVVQIAEAAKQPAVNPEYIGSLLTILELFTLETRYTEAIAWADHAVEIFNANKEALSFESVARLIRLAAKIAGDKPDYRQDAEELDKMMTVVSRAYSFGSFVWEFEPVDDFMKTNPNI